MWQTRPGYQPLDSPHHNLLLALLALLPLAVAPAPSTHLSTPAPGPAGGPGGAIREPVPAVCLRHGGGGVPSGGVLLPGVMGGRLPVEGGVVDPGVDGRWRGRLLLEAVGGCVVRDHGR